MAWTSWPSCGRAGAASERHLHRPCLHQCGSRFDHRSARQARQPIKDVVHETDRVSGQVLSDKEYVDKLLKDLPDIYQVLARQGLNGDYFGFYFCEVLLKLNGKGGNPIFVKLLGQPSGGVHAAMRLKLPEVKSADRRSPFVLGVTGTVILVCVTVVAFQCRSGRRPQQRGGRSRRLPLRERLIGRQSLRPVPARRSRSRCGCGFPARG
jgi:hypothetical protein